MRAALAAVLVSAIVVVGYFGGPIVPTALGAILGGALCWRNVRARRRRV
jgi:hypothetical protein